jgi:hypothetical protein
VSYILEVLAAADEENVQTVEWLCEHASLSSAERYVATIARALQEIVELPLAWPARKGTPRSASATSTRSLTR